MVERKGDIPNLTFEQATGGPSELDRLRAALALHRPQLNNKWGHPTTDITQADPRYTRCGACGRGVTFAGCTTWSTAYPTPAAHQCEDPAKCWADPDCPIYSSKPTPGGAR